MFAGFIHDDACGVFALLVAFHVHHDLLIHYPIGHLAYFLFFFGNSNKVTFNPWPVPPLPQPSVSFTFGVILKQITDIMYVHM